MKKVFLALTNTLVSSTLVLSSAVLAQSEDTFEEGVHFLRIENPTEVDSDGVEVVEVFSYACPACAQFEPYLERWIETAPENIEFSRLPLAGQPMWTLMAQGYQTASVLGIVEAGHGELFDALHTKRQPIRNLEDLAEFWSQYGTSAEEFLSTAESFAIDARMRKDQARAGRWQVTATPTLVINGKWRLGAGRNYPGNQTWDDVFGALDHLIALETQDEAADDAAVEADEEAEEAQTEEEAAEEEAPAS